MKRILLTGMSDCGKSTVLAALASADTLCVDLDTDRWITADSTTGERLIRTAALLAWMETKVCKNLVLAVCGANQAELYPALDAVIVLTAPLDVMRSRIRSRTDPYGKSAVQWRQIVADKAEVEPLLLKNCTFVCPTARPLPAVLQDIKQFLEG